MAFKMAFTDAYGNENPESYWRVMFVAIDLTVPQARTVLLGYKNQAAHESGKLPILQKEYTVSGEDFAAMMTPYQSGENTDVFAMAYQVAKQTKDVGEGDDKVSFFETAEEV